MQDKYENFSIFETANRPTLNRHAPEFSPSAQDTASQIAKQSSSAEVTALKAQVTALQAQAQVTTSQIAKQSPSVDAVKYHLKRDSEQAFNNQGYSSDSSNVSDYTVSSNNSEFFIQESERTPISPICIEVRNHDKKYDKVVNFSNKDYRFIETLQIKAKDYAHLVKTAFEKNDKIKDLLPLVNNIFVKYPIQRIINHNYVSGNFEIDKIAKVTFHVNVNEDDTYKNFSIAMKTCYCVTCQLFPRPEKKNDSYPNKKTKF